MNTPPPVLPVFAMCRDMASGDLILASQKVLDMDLFTYANSQSKRSEGDWQVFKDLLQAVMTLHKMGIVHGCIRAEAIWLLKRLDAFDRLQLCIQDFGMSQSALEEVRAEGGMTSAYQAPEVSDPDLGKIDGKAADFFACGVVGFALATGRYPWVSTCTTACKTFAFAKKYGVRQLLQHPRCPATRCRLPEEYMLILESLLTLDPAMRLMNFHSLAHLLVPEGEQRR